MLFPVNGQMPLSQRHRHAKCRENVTLQPHNVGIKSKENKSQNMRLHPSLSVLPQTLQIDKLRVSSSFAHQFIVRAVLDNHSLIENVDDIGLLDRA